MNSPGETSEKPKEKIASQGQALEPEDKNQALPEKPHSTNSGQAKRKLPFGKILVAGIVILITLLAFGLIAYLIMNHNKTQAITSYEECVAAGYPIMESYPEQCAANSQTFTRKLTHDEKQDNQEPTPTLDPKYKDVRIYEGDYNDLINNCTAIEEYTYGPLRLTNNEIVNAVGYLIINGKLVSKNEEGWYMGQEEGWQVKSVYIEIPKQTEENKDFYETYFEAAGNNWAGAETNTTDLLFRLGGYEGEGTDLVFSSSADVPANFSDFIKNNIDTNKTVGLKLYITEPDSGGDAPGNFTGACKIEIVNK